MKYFKYWVHNRRDASDEKAYLFVAASTEDQATTLTERVYPVSTLLKLREIAEADLPDGKEWLK